MPFLAHGGEAPAKASRRQEDRRARELGGQRRKGSGNRAGQRGDLDVGPGLGEIKYTMHASYALKIAELRKIREEAVAIGRVPFFGVEFREAQAVAGELWIMVPFWAAQEWLAGLVAEARCSAVR